MDVASEGLVWGTGVAENPGVRPKPMVHRRMINNGRNEPFPIYCYQLRDSSLSGPVFRPDICSVTKIVYLSMKASQAKASDGNQLNAIHDQILTETPVTLAKQLFG